MRRKAEVPAAPRDHPEQPCGRDRVISLRREPLSGHSSAVMFDGPDRLFRRYQQTGEPRLLGAVFDRTAGELLRVATHLTRDRHRAEDLVQTTFLTAIEKAHQYDPSRPLLP